MKSDVLRNFNSGDEPAELAVNLHQYLFDALAQEWLCKDGSGSVLKKMAMLVRNVCPRC